MNIATKVDSQNLNLVIERYDNKSNKVSNICKDIIASYRDSIETSFNLFKQNNGSTNPLDLNDDFNTKRDYIEVLRLFSLSIPKLDGQFMLVLKIGNVVQGVLTAKPEKEDNSSIHVSALFTAPWNLRMHANLKFSTQSPTKGIGKLLMEYLFNLDLPIQKIILNPMKESINFYKALGMKEECDGIMTKKTNQAHMLIEPLSI